MTQTGGQLYVTRGYGSGVSGDSGSLGDTPSSPDNLIVVHKSL